MKSHAVLAGCIVLIVFFPGISHGVDLSGLQPPAPYGVFSTMSAESPSKGRAAMGFTYETLLNNSFYRFGSNMAYGLNERVEASLSVSSQRDGFEDVALGLKHRFIGTGMRGTSVAYLLTTSIDTGSKEIGTQGRYGGGLILSDKVGPFWAHFNIFYGVPGNNRYKGEFRSSAGIVFSAAHNIWLLGEAYVRSSHFSEEIDQFETRVGYRALLADNIYANLGLGIDFRHDPTNYRFLASLAFHVPWEERKIKRIYEDK